MNKETNTVSWKVFLLWITAQLVFSAVLHGQTKIDAVYFGQTHVQKTDNPYFTMVGDREALIKVHVVDPAEPVSPMVSATVNRNGAVFTITLSGPASLPALIVDGPGAVQHSDGLAFTAIIPAEWVQPGITVTVNAGAQQEIVSGLEIGAPNKVIMTMTDVHFFELDPADYAAGWEEELEAKWPVADLEIRRADDVVFPELVMVPREGKRAARVTSEQDYVDQVGIAFNGENSTSTSWNVALRRAAGRKTGVSLYYLNHYNTPTKGVAGGFSGVGSGRSLGILHHELGHALSLPHWGDSSSYPYKGAQHGILAPAIYNETHAGPTWAYDLPGRAFIPATTQPGNVGQRPVGTYKADPMQGGGTGFSEPGYLLNHFSDFSINQIQNYMEGVVVVWNEARNSYAKWNSTDQDYMNDVSNNGIDYPLVRGDDVISVMASVSGASPEVNMVYPPIGPYTAGQIRLFDPEIEQDRLDAQALFPPGGRYDVSLRVQQGGVSKVYMVPAAYDTSASPTSASSLITEAINLPASGGAVTQIELLLTPDADLVGLPANPDVLYKWTPATAPSPSSASFASVPTTLSENTISMTATLATGDSDFNGKIEYRFTEVSGNPGGTTSEWQSSPTYVDENLQPLTEYRYHVAVRSGVSKAEGMESGVFTATTDPTFAIKTILSSGGSDSWNVGTWSAGIPAVSIDAEIAAGVAAQIASPVSGWAGDLVLKDGASLWINSGGESLLPSIATLTLENASIFDAFGSTQSFPPIILVGGGAFDTLNLSPPRLDSRNFDGVISGDGGFGIDARGLTTYRFNTTNTFTGGLNLNTSGRHLVELNAAGSAGQGDVIVTKASSDQSAVIRVGADDVFAPSATLRLEGKGWDNIGNFEYRSRLTLLDMRGFNASVARLFIDGIEMPAGDYTGTADTQDWIDGAGTLTVNGLPTFAGWIAGFPGVGTENGFEDDPDGDGVSNGIENYFGTDPSQFSDALTLATSPEGLITISHPKNPSAAGDIDIAYQWSIDLVTFYESGELSAGGTSLIFTEASAAGGGVTVTATSSEADMVKVFLRISATH